MNKKNIGSKTKELWKNPEYIKHMKEIHIGKEPWNKGRKENRLDVLKRQSNAQKGSKSYLWKGGISPKNKTIRHGLEFRLWRKSVFERDNYTCQNCGIQSGCGYKIYLHPHHILNFSSYIDLRFEVSNGVTLCNECHWEFHNIYGKKNNSREQLNEFLNI